ncbi:hypothetical protein PVAP13_6KG201012, partial [Panicum virgatum]
SRHNKPKKAHKRQVVPQDYICDAENIQIVEYIIGSKPGKKIMVEIKGEWVYRSHMECLFHDDRQVLDDVLNSYIHCMRGEEHLLQRDGGKVFLENSYISNLLHKDGKMKEDEFQYTQDTIRTRVDNYLDHDMVFFPINIARFHWYLAVVNAHEREIQVLDSFGKMDRAELKTTIIGLHRHIKIAAQHKQLNQQKWRCLDVINWPVREKIHSPMQTGGYSSS